MHVKPEPRGLALNVKYQRSFNRSQVACAGRLMTAIRPDLLDTVRQTLTLSTIRFSFMNETSNLMVFLLFRSLPGVFANMHEQTGESV